MENTEVINELETIPVDESIIENTVIEIPEESSEQEMSYSITESEELSEQEPLINDNANQEIIETSEEYNPADGNATAPSAVSENSVITVDDVEVNLPELKEYSEAFTVTESMTSSQADEMIQLLSDISIYSSLTCFFLAVHLGYILSRFICGRFK